MKWRGRRTSTNIEDRRRGGGGARAGGIGIVGLLIVMAAGLLFGVDISPLVGGGGGGQMQSSAPAGPNEIDDQTEEFVGVVLADRCGPRQRLHHVVRMYVVGLRRAYIHTHTPRQHTRR